MKNLFTLFLVWVFNYLLVLEFLFTQGSHFNPYTVTVFFFGFGLTTARFHFAIMTAKGTHRL